MAKVLSNILVSKDCFKHVHFLTCFKYLALKALLLHSVLYLFYILGPSLDASTSSRMNSFQV